MPKFDTVADLQNTDYILVNTDYDVNELNREYNQDYGCYFVLIGDGEYISMVSIPSRHVTSIQDVVKLNIVEVSYDIPTK